MNLQKITFCVGVFLCLSSGISLVSLKFTLAAALLIGGWGWMQVSELLKEIEKLRS